MEEGRTEGERDRGWERGRVGRRREGRRKEGGMVGERERVEIKSKRQIE